MVKKLPKNEFLTYIPFSSKLFLALHAYPPFSPDKMRLTFNFYLFERQTPPHTHTQSSSCWFIPRCLLQPGLCPGWSSVPRTQTVQFSHTGGWGQHAWAIFCLLAWAIPEILNLRQSQGVVSQWLNPCAKSQSLQVGFKQNWFYILASHSVPSAPISGTWCILPVENTSSPIPPAYHVYTKEEPYWSRHAAVQLANTSSQVAFYGTGAPSNLRESAEF